MFSNLFCASALFLTAVADQGPEAKKKVYSPFEILVSSSAFIHLAYGFVPNFAHWEWSFVFEQKETIQGFALGLASDLQASQKDENLPLSLMHRAFAAANRTQSLVQSLAYLALLKSAPKELLRVLESPTSKDHQSALNFVTMHAALARKVAWDRGRKDLDKDARRAFFPYADRIHRAVIKLQESPEWSIRIQAALTVLALDPNDSRANAILMECAKAQNMDRPVQWFNKQSSLAEMIGWLQLSNKAAINYLEHELKQKSAERRQAAGVAAWKLGEKAKDLVPSLIELLKDEEASHGVLEEFSVGTLGRAGNIALAALAEIGPHATAAVPSLIKMLQSGTDGSEVLGCLAKIGPAPAKQSIPAIERLLRNDDPTTRIEAACALICIKPGNSRLPSILKTALLGIKGSPREQQPSEKNIVRLGLGTLFGIKGSAREQALMCFYELTPRSESLCPVLITILKSDEYSCKDQTLAAIALGNMGAAAASAVSALENRLMSEKVRDTDVSGAAAMALVSIGQPAIPALRRAMKDPVIASCYLVPALINKKSAESFVDDLARIIRGKHDEISANMAASALASLREDARSARALLQPGPGDDLETRLLLQWVLSEIGD